MVTILSTIKKEKGIFIFEDINKNKQKLLNVIDFSINHSRVAFHCFRDDKEVLSLMEDVDKWIASIHDGSIVCMMRSIILLSVLDELIQKPQVYNFLHIGEFSSFDECLGTALKKFNDNSHLYCLTDKKPDKEMTNISFISMKLGEFMLPSSKFSAIFIDDMHSRILTQIPIDVLLSLRDRGKVFFLSVPNSPPQPFPENRKEFKVSENLFLTSFYMTAKIREMLYKQTPEAKLNGKKRQIIKIIKEFSQNVNKLLFLPTNEQNSALDHAISSLHQSEKIINEIYPNLNSAYIKPYFNELKEALIDYRLQHENEQSHKSQMRFYKIEKAYNILLNEMTAQDDFNFEDKKEAI